MKRRRTALAAAFAVATHLLVLTALGWRAPKVEPPPVPDALPPIELSLVRIRPESPAPAASIKGAPRSSRAQTTPSTPTAPSPALPSRAAPANSSVPAAGPPDCEVEDLPLLTDAERGRCRDQIAGDKARRAAQGADARIAKQVAEAKAAPRMDRMAPEKRAYYDAVAQAYDQQSHGPPMAGKNPGFACGGHPPHSLKLGPIPCFITPPQGFLTEESGLDPLDRQWLHKR